MILVTGANGHLGRSIVTELLSHRSADQIIATVRDIADANDISAYGIDVRKGDFSDPGELQKAFAGSTRALVVSVNQLGDEALRMHQNAINAALSAGTRRVFYTSHMGANPESAFAPACDHALTEANLAQANMDFTSLRHGFYAESALHLIGSGIEDAQIRTPEDGPVNWTTRRDLAAADAALLAGEMELDGLTPPLTAGAAVTMSEFATIASEVTGRDIKHVTLTDRQWIDEKVSQGIPRYMADMLLGAFIAARRGDFSAVDPTLETLLQRRPTTLREFLAARLSSA